MIPTSIDLFLRVCRLLGTVRSLVVQTEQIIDIVSDTAYFNDSVVDGLEL
jgi:hypothetical protein